MSVPVPQNVTPASCPRDGQQHTITITGDTLSNVTDVKLGQWILAGPITTVGDEEAQVEIRIDDRAPLGKRDVVVVNPDGDGILRDRFEVVAA
ncbi:MAG: hypothetical protein OER85_14730 [Gammaproteobacteria bacterium]|nr:hypothetical protein [Gammaproteobacteria bacterium]